MTLTLDTARDLWAARYGYEWRSYAAKTASDPAPEIAIDTAVWSQILELLMQTSSLDIDYQAGKTRLKEWKS